MFQLRLMALQGIMFCAAFPLTERKNDQSDAIEGFRYTSVPRPKEIRRKLSLYDLGYRFRCLAAGFMVWMKVMLPRGNDMHVGRNKCQQDFYET